ncbi:metallophosphoesterase family protein [Leptospira perdikensis]|uniref:Phosphohydrolase n=1 Tax=Leptospira perdikensis TaxID=2484948 RepID=A0A4R9JGP7_9LEPT|nr:metallophosphoesterase [Leptospira perdikensis]TGL40931.1 phosphohydrolase [Leptospira perdikensis]
MKILHISDLHFPKKLSLFSLRGKALVGYLNYRLRRKSKHPLVLISAMIEAISKLEYDALVISGDLTNVSHPREFENAKEILSPLLTDKTFIIPGNHDRYQKRAIGPNPLFEKTFGEWIGNSLDSNLYIRSKNIGGKLFIGWDSNFAIPRITATGYVAPEVVQKTLGLVKEPYVLVCHHPLWNPTNEIESKGHWMANRGEVVKQLKTNPPFLYLHGHTHTNWVKLPGKDAPFAIVNSASSTRLSDRSHECGFHIIEIEKSVQYRRFIYSEDKFIETNPIFYEESEGVI